MRNACLSLAFVVGCATSAVAQTAVQRGSSPAQPKFTTETTFVEVAAIVTTEQGEFVRNLSEDDFEIYEDGTPQKTATFSFIDAPIQHPLIPANSTEPLEWDVLATTRSFEGRIYVLGLDDLHTAFTRSQAVREAARGFVTKYLGENDLAAVVYSSGRQEAGQELTGKRQLLLAAIDRFQGRKLPAAGVEKLAIHLREEGALKATDGPGDRRTESLQKAQSIRDPNEAERAANVKRALRSIESVAAWMSDVEGRRKALLWFSEGFDYDIYEPFSRGLGDSLVRDAQQAIAAAQRANLSIYGIDPRGLAQFGEFVEVGPQSDYPQLGYGTYTGFLRDLLLSQESLLSLSEQTGGFAIVHSNDMAGGLGRIVLDNSRYYLLGYYSNSSKSTGKFLKIDVRLKRPGLRVRARQGFLPPTEKTEASRITPRAGTSPSLQAALAKPLPIGNLDIRALAAPFKGRGKNASLFIGLEVDGAGLTFEDREGRFYDLIEVSIVASDQRAQVRGGDRQTFELRLLEDTYSRIKDSGVRLFSRLDLPPGRYQVRIGASETGRGAAAMLPYDLEIPDYSEVPLTLSGVLLTSTNANMFATANEDPVLRDVLPSPPVVSRKFTTLETLSYFVEAYSASAFRSALQLRVRVEDVRDGRIVFAAEETASPSSGSRMTSYAFHSGIPLRGWEAGIYVLVLEVTSQDRRVERSVPFEVLSP